MNAGQIREMVLDRMEVLAPFVSEYVRLVEANRMLGEIPEVKQARPHRRRGRPPRALQEARQAHEARLHVQTIRMPRSEFEDRELVYTTEEPATNGSSAGAAATR